MSMRVELAFREEEKRPKLGDISYLLYNLELLHDLSLIVSLKEYKDYKIPPSFWYRGGRPLKDEHKERTIRIVKESPLVLEVIIGAPAAALILLKAAREIDTWMIEREKLKEEKKKAEAEREKTEIERESAKIDLEGKLEESGATGTYDKIRKRLEDLPIELEDIEVRERED